MRTISRRGLLQSAAATGLLTAASSRAAFASESELLVNTYGGVYARAMDEGFVAHFRNATGRAARAVVDIPNAAISKIQATLPNPDYDLFVGTANDTIRAIELGIVEPIDLSRLPSLANVPSRYWEIWRSMGVSFSTGITGFLYDKRVIPNPPRSWAEFVERTISGEFGQTVALNSINSSGSATGLIYPIADAFGGSAQNADIAFEKLAQMVPYITKFIADQSEVIQLMATGEVSIAPYPDGRAWQFIDNGNDWADFVIPERGGVFSSSQISKVVGSPDIAWELMDTYFNPEAASAFVDIIGYPVTAPVTYSELMASRQPSEEDVLYPPYFDLYQVSAEWIDRWNREIGG